MTGLEGTGVLNVDQLDFAARVATRKFMRSRSATVMGMRVDGVYAHAASIAGLIQYDPTRKRYESISFVARGIYWELKKYKRLNDREEATRQRIKEENIFKPYRYDENPAERELKDVQQRILVENIDNLPRRQREILEVYSRTGSYAEAAQELNCTKDAVRQSVIRSSCRILNAALKPDWRNSDRYVICDFIKECDNKDWRIIAEGIFGNGRFMKEYRTPKSSWKHVVYLVECQLLKRLFRERYV